MNSLSVDHDSLWMLRAVELARNGFGTTSPNPPVGAVIERDGLLLGEGYHEVAGEAHAEKRAIENARKRGNENRLKGATLYVTLEPCSSHGRTAPCTDAIIEAGISRVVYGAIDPDERHVGRANEILRAHGIEVCSGVCELVCEHLVRSWAWSVKHRRPWVLAKVATTMDGRMTRRDDRWLSSPKALRHTHQLRAESDAILVGGGTVRMDDPALTIRTPLQPPSPRKKQPWRIIMTRDRKSLPAESCIFTDEFADRTVVMEDVQDFTAMLEELYSKYDIVNLMLECGGPLLRSFLERGLVNEWVQDIAPILGGGPAPMLPGDYLPRECRFKEEEIMDYEPDIILRGILE